MLYYFITFLVVLTAVGYLGSGEKKKPDVFLTVLLQVCFVAALSSVLRSILPTWLILLGMIVSFIIALAIHAISYSFVNSKPQTGR